MSKRSAKKVRHYNTDLSTKEKLSARSSCPPPYPHRQVLSDINDDIPPFNSAGAEEHDAMVGFMSNDTMEVNDDELIIAPSDTSASYIPLYDAEEAEFFGDKTE